MTLERTVSSFPNPGPAACESCGSNKFDSVCDRKDGSTVVRCVACELEFVHPLPSQQDLDNNYLKEMRGDASRPPYFEEYIQERQNRCQSYEKVYQSRLDLIERFYPKKGNLLDIGCGAGFFLKCARKRGWNEFGIDLLPEYIQYAKEHLQLQQVQSGPLEEAEYPAHFFDIVTMWDLIEHLVHPLKSLRQINSILKPGGMLVIWTPNVRNAVFLNDQWTGYWPRQHLYFFGYDSLNRLLSQAGFQIAYSKTNKTKKGLLIRQDSLTFEKKIRPEKGMERFWFTLKRDFKNFINPLTYLGPVLDVSGFGFNLFVIASKTGEPD